jgi:glutathione synthase/RimK-type ligase-like ATP-grasp enzyme
MNDRSNILLLSHGQEPFCTEKVAGALTARGFTPLRLDTDTFPRTLTLGGELGMNARPRVLLGERELDVAAVWLWRLWSPQLDPGLEAAHREAAARESMTTLRGLLDLLAHVPWIDAIDLNRCAENKARQLRLACELGLSIPPTLITADPAAARRFFHAHGGRVIAKLQAPLAQSMAGGGGLPTRLLQTADLDALDGLRTCPMMFQRYVDKAYELRIAWVDGQALVGALDGRRCGVDWRYESTASWEPHVLPTAIHDRLARLMARLGLRQGAIDMIVEPSGDYIFLEVNPHGEWGMLERDLGLEIGDAIASALIRLARQRHAD